MTSPDTRPVVLACPRPGECTVARTLPDWEVVEHKFTERRWHRVYNGTWGFDEFNPGYAGNARFSPIESAAGKRVPNLYLARTETAALLETVLRVADELPVRRRRARRVSISEGTLRDWLLVSMTTERPAMLADFRNEALSAYGMTREEIATSSAEHYPCTRTLATQIHADPRGVEGIIWHSRQAECTGYGDVEAVVLFGDRFPDDRGYWTRRDAGSRNLFRGEGRELVEQIAEALDIYIDPVIDT